MFELRYVPGLVRFSLLGTTAALAIVSSFTEAKAIGAPRALAAIVGDESRHGQSGGSATGQEASPAAAGDQVEGDVPFSELNEALSAARSRLAELTKAAEIAKVAGELRQDLETTQAENRKLRAALSQAKADIAELQKTSETAGRQAEESDKVAAENSAEARRLDEELVAMRWQNSQLSTSLARAETVAKESTEELGTIEGKLASRIEALTSNVERKTTEVAGLKKELDATRESALIAEQRGVELDELSAEDRARASEAEAKAEKLAKDLDITISELGSARTELSTTRGSLEEVSIALTAANQETAVLREQFATNRRESDQLRNRLETTEAELSQTNAQNGELTQQVQILRTAAGEATDAARLNLIAVEKQIDEINAALATAKGNELLAPSGGPALQANSQGSADAGDEANGNLAPATVANADNAWVPPLTPARATAIGQQQLIAAASPAVVTPARIGNPPAAASPLANRVIHSNGGGTEAPNVLPVQVASLITELPNQDRARAETLFADLNVRPESRGLTMTVPGAILFAVNSETIEPDAYDTLAKVAEMVDLYKDKKVLIVGHTDAVGDDGYNQQLSERRADLVKTYFADQFKIERGRISAEGQGEKSPITSNATAQGRDANRRVEVIILN